nr:PDZ domain-containing protein [Candidatus Dormibacteraeota bacterium]
DVITAVGSYTLIGGADQFHTAVAARRPGDTMALTIARGGTDLTLAVEFPRDPVDAGSIEAESPGSG